MVPSYYTSFPIGRDRLDNTMMSVLGILSLAAAMPAQSPHGETHPRLYYSRADLPHLQAKAEGKFLAASTTTCTPSSWMISIVGEDRLPWDLGYGGGPSWVSCCSVGHAPASTVGVGSEQGRRSVPLKLSSLHQMITDPPPAARARALASPNPTGIPRAQARLWPG